MTLTISIAAALMVGQSADPVRFSHNFVEDESSTYTMGITGTTEAGQLQLFFEYQLKVAGVTEDSRSKVQVSVISATFAHGDETEESMHDEVSEFEVKLDRFGAPSAMGIHSQQSSYSNAFLTRYLPDKELEVGDEFKIDLKLEDATFKGKGKFVGYEVLKGTKYAVLKSNSTLSPNGEENHEIESKNFVDPASGTIVLTEATMQSPYGEFKFVIKQKAKKK